MPTTQADDDRARRELHRAARDAHPGRVEQARRGARESESAEQPRDRCDHADVAAPRAPTAASDLAAGRAERAQQGELARRCATVIEKVLKMMNAPTSSAAPAKASSTGVRNAPSESLICFDVVGGGLLAGLDLKAARQRRPQPLRTISLGRHARRRRGDDARHLASSRYQRCTSASGATMIVAPPIEATLPKSTMPTSRARLDAGARRDADALADGQVLVGGELALTTISPEAGGRRPVTSAAG